MSQRDATKALFLKSFTYPQGSPQRLRAFKRYLKALKDEHKA